MNGAEDKISPSKSSKAQLSNIIDEFFDFEQIQACWEAIINMIADEHNFQDVFS